MESQKPCRKVESKTSDRKMDPNKKKRKNKNIDPKKNKKEKNKDLHSNKEKSTGDKLFLKKVYSKWTKFYEMFRRALSKARRYTMFFCVVISNNTSGKDEMQEILVIPQTELQDFTNLECLTTLQLPRVSIPLIGESPEESCQDPESVVNGSEKCSDTRTIVISDQFDPTYESKCEGVWGNSNTHGDTCNMFPSESLSGNDSLGRIDATFEDIRDKMQELTATIQTELQALTKAERNLSFNIPSLSGESPEELHGDTESVVNRSENCSDTRTQEQFGPTCESNCKGVQLNSMTLDELLKMVNEINLTDRLPSTSLSGNVQEYSLDRTDSFFSSSRRQVVELCEKSEKRISDINDQFQQFSARFPLSNDTNFSRRQETQLYEQMISYLIDQLPQISAKLRPSNDTRRFSVVNCKVHWLNQAHASIILLKDSDVVVGLIKSSHLQEILLDISPISDSLLVHKPQPATIQTFQGILQRMGLPVNLQLYEPQEHSNTTNVSEELSHVVIVAEDCQRLFSVVNSKVHWLEQAHASGFALKDSDVVVGLIKSSHLQEILLDISPISESLVRKSKPVTLQTFQGIMQRMGLPVNPQLYEPQEHSNTTNVSEELSHVVIVAEDCQRYYYIPVQRGSYQTIYYRNKLLPF